MKLAVHLLGHEAQPTRLGAWQDARYVAVFNTMKPVSTLVVCPPLRQLTVLVWPPSRSAAS